nr:hypothetical protein [Chryseobacterium glaciei]
MNFLWPVSWPRLPLEKDRSKTEVSPKGILLATTSYFSFHCQESLQNPMYEYYNQDTVVLAPFL